MSSLLPATAEPPPPSVDLLCAACLAAHHGPPSLLDGGLPWPPSQPPRVAELLPTTSHHLPHHATPNPSCLSCACRYDNGIKSLIDQSSAWRHYAAARAAAGGLPLPGLSSGQHATPVRVGGGRHALLSMQLPEVRSLAAERVVQVAACRLGSVVLTAAGEVWTFGEWAAPDGRYCPWRSVNALGSDDGQDALGSGHGEQLCWEAAAAAVAAAACPVLPWRLLVRAEAAAGSTSCQLFS